MFLTAALYLHLDNLSIPKTQILRAFEMLCTQPCVCKDKNKKTMEPVSGGPCVLNRRSTNFFFFFEKYQIGSILNRSQKGFFPCIVAVHCFFTLYPFYPPCICGPIYGIYSISLQLVFVSSTANHRMQALKDKQITST